MWVARAFLKVAALVLAYGVARQVVPLEGVASDVAGWLVVAGAVWVARVEALRRLR